MPLTLYEASLINKAIRVGRRVPMMLNDWLHLAVGAQSQDWGHQPRHWPDISLRGFQTMMTEQLSLMFYFYQILISRERGPSSLPPLPVPRPHQRSPPVPDQTETLRRKYRGPVRQKTHNQYVWVTVCCWSAHGFYPFLWLFFPRRDLFHICDSWLLKSN